MNSLYGALGNAYFRHFDLNMAEAITISGQLSIRWAERAVNEKLNYILETNNVDYIIAIDTDSLYVNFGPLVKKFSPKNPVDFLDKVCNEVFESVLKESYQDLFEHFSCYSNRMEMKRESIADRGIWTAKKRYILNVHDNEGVRYSEPKLKIMGIEAIKSSTPSFCRKALKDSFKIIISGSELEVRKFINEFKEEFFSLPPEEVSFPRGVSDIEKWVDRRTKYKKGTPIHVRGSILFNGLIEGLNLKRKYAPIQSGDKIKFCYLKMPNPIHEDVISFNEYLPPELNLHKYIDYEKQYQKTFLDSILLILDPIGYKVEDTQTLESFFI